VPYGFLADLTVFVHFAFILFVVGGGILVRWWPKLLWAHLAAAAWGAYVSLANRICPLTPLEKWLTRQAGGPGYAGGFMEQHLFWIIYPRGLTPGIQRLLGVGVIVLNAGIYAWLWSRRKRLRPSSPPSKPPV
jgi:hypothetical protein